MLFSRALVGNSRAAKTQWDAVVFSRNAANTINQRHARELRVNAGLIPRDVWQEFDNVTVTRMRSDDGDAFLNDLMPLSRSINIGRLVLKYRQASDAGLAKTSMSGQTGIITDHVDYAYDGTIVPIHDAGFSREWREWEGMQAEGFDALIDDQRETVETVRRLLADTFMDGHRDQEGNLIVVDALSWAGVRNDSRVAQIDLGPLGLNFDFTSSGVTGEQIKDAWITMRDVLWISNNCEMDVNYYISREIMSNFERKYSAQYDSKLIKAELSQLMGVADIKVTNKLTGNQIMAFPLDANRIRPLVAMGLNTSPVPRRLYNDKYQFMTWTALGWYVKNDFFGRTCIMYASA